jgi:hypothetical protein
MTQAAVVAGDMSWYIIVIVVVAISILTLWLPKKLHYIFNGVALLILGGAHIFYEFYFTAINLTGSPLVRFVIAFVVMVTAKELIQESIKEKGSMRVITFVIGGILIALSLIPELYHVGAINFNIPEYPLLFSFLYVIGGIVAVLTPFFLKE